VALNVEDLEETPEGHLGDAAPLEDGPGRARSARCDPPRRDSVPRSSPADMARHGGHHRRRHLSPNLNKRAQRVTDRRLAP
jgi:hypothetical protein